MDFLKGVLCGIFICPIITVIFGMTVTLIKEAFKKEKENDDR